ncbi:MAG: hypothetical protein V7767_06210 [Leeuwenhoekiella sp.]
MKATAYSFLFFIVISVFAYKNGKGQTISAKEIDSSSIYYQILLNPENSIDYNQAVKYYQIQYEEHIASNSILKAANDLEIIANGKYNIGDFNESEKVLIQALKIHKNSNSFISQNAKKRINNRLGMIYHNLKSYDKSLELYSRSLKTSKNSTDSISIFINVSNVLREKENFTKSVDTLKHALMLVEKSANPYLKAYILDNLGYTEFLSNNNLGLIHLTESIKLREKLEDNTGLFSNYRHVTLYYKRNGSIEKASYFAQKALSLSKKIKDPSYELAALSLLAALDDNSNINRFEFLNDSLLKANQNSQNKYAAMKYDVEKEKEQTQIAKLQSEKEKQRKTLYLALAFIMTVIFVAIVIIMLYHRKRKQLQTIINTESRISKKLHDELANDTFQVMAQIQMLEEVPREIIDELDKIYAKTRDISKDHSPINTDTDFYEQLKDMLASYKSADLNVITRNGNTINWDSLSSLKKTTVYTVLKELMTNNRKHSKSNLALITFNQNGKKLAIQYQDNGQGSELKKNNGLQNAESRIKALKGTLTFETQINKGFKVNIQI